MDYYLAIKRKEWLEKGLAVEGIAALADPDLTPSTHRVLPGSQPLQLRQQPCTCAQTE